MSSNMEDQRLGFEIIQQLCVFLMLPGGNAGEMGLCDLLGHSLNVSRTSEVECQPGQMTAACQLYNSMPLLVTLHAHTRMPLMQCWLCVYEPSTAAHGFSLPSSTPTPDLTATLWSKAAADAWPMPVRTFPGLLMEILLAQLPTTLRMLLHAGGC